MNRITNKILSIAFSAGMILSMTGCGKNSSSTAQPVSVTGTTIDTGKISVLVPDGWMQSSNHGTDPEKNVYLIKSDTEVDSAKVPSIYITYGVPGDNMISAREYYPDAKDLDPVDAAGIHWNAYAIEAYGRHTVLEAEGNFGFAQIDILNSVDGGNGTAELKDADVQAVINSISFNPAITGDWFSVNEDGKLYLKPEQVEGYKWNADVDFYTNDVSIGFFTEEDGTIIVSATGTGTGGAWLYQLSDDETVQRADAHLSFGVEDGKILFVSKAEMVLE